MITLEPRQAIIQKLTFFGRVPSKKNSKQIVRGRLISSKAYLEWEQEELLWLAAISPLEGSFAVVAEFWLPDRRKTDLSNKWESIADCLVKAGILIDDNCEVLPDIRLIYRGIDKQAPRVELTLKTVGEKS